MKTIAVESDVYSHLLEQIALTGESVSAFLRQRLGINSAASVSAGTTSDLDEALSGTDFRYAKGVVGRFLAILTWLYQRHQADFERVEKIKGRGRLYFAKSPQLLEEAGNNVNPKQIPKSPFWVITTTPTILKQEMLGNVMQAFGYSDSDIRKAQTAIAGT